MTHPQPKETYPPRTWLRWGSNWTEGSLSDNNAPDEIPYLSLEEHEAILAAHKYPPQSIAEWRKFTDCCYDEDTASAADQAIAKCKDYYEALLREARAEAFEEVAALAVGHPEYETVRFFAETKAKAARGK